ncbi:hypothetical protein [Natrinema longum]|uniref:Phosphohydrolase n=1 Tax=Natrinema longum TaxID=370324 RepID=A0A8A2UA12_9EURY|nr:hypothetical protein [Natrinema longum]MBZ6496635.1 hypothetical protein [Natrinema longum]QSW85467.1 hypothetical protein J0X27_01075 [Natrinema longum]
MSDPWDRVGVVETYTGGRFDLFDPDPDDIRLQDIATALAHTCRFGGHCQWFYSVAHHSIHVSRELPSADPRLQLLGLLHDAGEAYIGDIPRPLKAEYEQFDRVEERILEAVWTAVALEPPSDGEWERVMAADDRLLAYEADRVLEDGSWAESVADLGYDLQSDSIDAIRDRFLSRGETLLNRLPEQP